jgi:hypothetical protein
MENEVEEIEVEEIIELTKLEYSLLSDIRNQQVAKGINYTFCKRCGLVRIINKLDVHEQKTINERKNNIITGENMKEKIVSFMDCFVCKLKFHFRKFLAIVGYCYGERSTNNNNYYVMSRCKELKAIGINTVHDVVGKFQDVVKIRQYNNKKDTIKDESMCDIEVKIILEAASYWLENYYKIRSRRLLIYATKFSKCTCRDTLALNVGNEYLELNNEDVEVMSQIEWKLYSLICERETQKLMNYNFCKKCSDAYILEEMTESQKQQMRERNKIIINRKELEKNVIEIISSIRFKSKFALSNFILYVGECYGEKNIMNKNYYVETRIKHLNEIGIYTVHDILVNFQKVIRMKRYVRENENEIDAYMCEIEAKIILEVVSFWLENEHMFVKIDIVE